MDNQDRMVWITQLLIHGRKLSSVCEQRAIHWATRLTFPCPLHFATLNHNCLPKQLGECPTLGESNLEPYICRVRSFVLLIPQMPGPLVMISIRCLNRTEVVQMTRIIIPLHTLRDVTGTSSRYMYQLHDIRICQHSSRLAFYNNRQQAPLTM
jgi:hypothetical protein